MSKNNDAVREARVRRAREKEAANIQRLQTAMNDLERAKRIYDALDAIQEERFRLESIS